MKVKKVCTYFALFFSWEEKMSTALILIMLKKWLIIIYRVVQINSKYVTCLPTSCTSVSSL